jgi:hypothetical protein
VQRHVWLVSVKTSDELKQVRRHVRAVRDQRTGFVVRIEACNQKDPTADHLRQGIVTMETRELVCASGKRMMPVHIKRQVSIGAHSPSGVHKVLKVSLELGTEQMRVCPHAGRRQPG